MFNDGLPLHSIDQHLTDKESEIIQLEPKIDKLTMELQPDVGRTVSKLPRDHGGEPICWMFAAATLLRTKEHVLTPHADLVSGLQRTKEELVEFLKKLKIRYDKDVVDGIKYWVKSKWWEQTQTQSMQDLWPYSWIDTYSDRTKPLKNRFLQTLVLERFCFKRGFQLSETIFLDEKDEQFSWKGQDWDLRMLQLAERISKEPALIGFDEDKWKIIKKKYRYSDALESDHTAAHALVLETFDAKSNEFILKNSHGPTGGTPKKAEGKIHIPRDAFQELGGKIQFIEKRTSVRGTGWLWAAATLIHQQPTVDVPLGEIMQGISLEWHKISKTVWKINIGLDVAGSEWGEHVKERGLNWGSPNHSRWQQKVSATTHQLLAIEVYSNSIGLQFAKKRHFPGGLSRWKPWLLSKVRRHGALVLLNTEDWRHISAESTNFHEETDNQSNPGPSQLMYLVKHAAADSDFWVQDTHGLKGGEPGAEDGRDEFSISEKELSEFDIWFLEERSVSTDTGVKCDFTCWDLSSTLPFDIPPDQVLIENEHDDI